MNYATYKKIRSYCWDDLSPYIDTKVSNNTLEWLRDLTGVTADINHEYSAAMGLFQTSDLTRREQSAAQLLAAVSNHRRYTWWREPITPDGSPPVEPLEPWQAAELWAQTRQAVKEYASFIPEREAVTLLALVEAAPATDTATPKLLGTESVSERIRGNLLRPLIKKAQLECHDPYDASEVFVILRVAAKAKTAPFTDVLDEGLKWDDSNDVAKILTLANLRDRLTRQKKTADKRANTR